MDTLLFHVIAWPTLGIAVFVFGFAPGALLRLIVLAFKRDDPRRHELLGELHAVPRIERPFWVAEQLEIACFEGLYSRIAARFNLWNYKNKEKAKKSRKSYRRNRYSSRNYRYSARSRYPSRNRRYPVQSCYAINISDKPTLEG
jgi:hypothetical protein